MWPFESADAGLTPTAEPDHFSFDGADKVADLKQLIRGNKFASKSSGGILAFICLIYVHVGIFIDASIWRQRSFDLLSFFAPIP